MSLRAKRSNPSGNDKIAAATARPRNDFFEDMIIVLVLDDIRSLYNVGSMFRTSDGLGVSKIFLCGYTGTPEQKGLQKVALGAEKSVAWEKCGPTWRTVERLKRDGFAAVGLEKCKGAIPIAEFHAPEKIALIVGNEVNGISPALQKRLDAIVELPMVGMKESYNVSVACAMALYAIMKG
jgi:23S rRNA (guanosine2251-2'-O)-methyltransferase